MAAPATIEDLWGLLWKSGLVETQQLTAYGQKIQQENGAAPETAEQLAQRLILDGLVTRFQAGQLLLGRWQGFTLGKYRLLERLGEGGMGAVYLAAHIHMRRRVAIKVLPPDKCKEPAALERFYREARAAAALDHPNIARAHDVDHEGRLHFLVMEYVDGASLQDIVAKSGPLPVPRALHYLRQAALGLQHAHESGLIHRDIKPGNLLVDRQGVVKILDMGLARFFADKSDNLTKELDAQSILGTADYIAPEQAMDSHSADIRSDLYSLGFTGYFLLTGTTPFGDGSAAQKLIWHQTRQPKPLRELRPEVGEEVAAILAKLCAKAPAERFATPKEAAEALRPFIPADVPNPPPDEMPQLCPAASGSGVVDPHHSVRISRDNGASPPSGILPKASHAPTTLAPRRKIVQVSRDQLEDLRRESPKDPAISAPRRANRAMIVVVALAISVLAVAGLFFWIGLTALPSKGTEVASRPAVKPAPQPVNKPNEKLLELLPGELRRFEGHTAAVDRLAVSPDGRMLATVAFDKTVRIWDTKTGNELFRCQGHTGNVSWVAWSPDGKHIVSSGKDKSCRLWDVTTGKEVRSFEGHTGAVGGVSFAPNSSTFASGAQDKTIRFWSVATGAELRRIDTPAVVHSLAYAPDGKHVLAAGWEDPVRWWDADTCKEVRRLEGHQGHVYTVAISPDGHRALTGGTDKVVRLWDLDTGQELRQLEGHTDHVWNVAFSPWGTYGLSSGKDHLIILWDLQTGQELHRFTGINESVAGVAFAPDGRFAYSCGHDRLARMWEIPKERLGVAANETGRLILPAPVTGVAMSADGQSALVAGGSGGFAIWDAQSGKKTDCFSCHREAVYDLTYATRGRRVAIGGTSGFSLWDLEQHQKVLGRIAATPAQVTCAALTPEDRYLLTGCADNTARLWRVDDGREAKRFEGHGGAVQGVAFTRDGVLTASRDGTVRLWNISDGRERRRFEGHAAGVNKVVATPDARTVLSAGDDETVRIWETETGRLLRTLEGHGGPVRALAVSADGRYVISGAADGRLRLWELATGRLVRVFSGHTAAITGVAFSLDGNYAVSGSADCSVRRWDLFLTDGLVANWKFDEAQGAIAADATGNGRDGALQGNATWTTDELHGRALRLDGVNSYVTVTNHPLLNPTIAMTVSAWIKPDKWEGNYRIVQKGTEDDQFRFLAEERVLRWEILRNRDRFVTTELPTPGQWHHIAGTYDSFWIRLYVDGKKVAEHQVHGNLPASNAPLCIGTKRSGAPAGDYFAGLLRDARLYDRALSDAEIEYLTTLTSGSTDKSKVP